MNLLKDLRDFFYPPEDEAGQSPAPRKKSGSQSKLLDNLRDFFFPADTPEEPAQPAVPDKPGRFSLHAQQLGGMTVYIVTDRKTGVSYLTKPGEECPFTPLLDADGKPYLTEH